MAQLYESVLDFSMLGLLSCLFISNSKKKLMNDPKLNRTFDKFHYDVSLLNQNQPETIV